MVQVPSLVLYGNSVFLAGIKAELERRLVLRLVTVEAGGPGAAELIRALRPCAVIFDLAVGQPEFAVALLRELPGLLLLGMDPSSDEMVVVSSFPAQALTMDDLIDVINRTDFSSQQFERRQDQEDCCTGELIHQKNTNSEAIKGKKSQGTYGNNGNNGLSDPDESAAP